MPRRTDQPLPWPHAPPRTSGCAWHLLCHLLHLPKAASFPRSRPTRSAPSRFAHRHASVRLAARSLGHFFSNHYHFVAKSPADASDAESLPFVIRALHGPLSRWINKLDHTPDRQVWHNYWETLLTHRTSYLARLNYTHNIPVKHGLVKSTKDYPWCSAGWFERETAPAMVKAIYRFKTDMLKVEDAFEPVWAE